MNIRRRFRITLRKTSRSH